MEKNFEITYSVYGHGKWVAIKRSANSDFNLVITFYNVDTEELITAVYGTELYKNIILTIK